MAALKLVIVENDLVFRDTVRSILENEFSTRITTITDDEDYIHQKNIVEADIIFINLAIAGRDDFKIIKSFLWDYPFIKVVAIYTHYSEQIFLIKLLEIGFKGCVHGNNIYFELKEVVNKILQGEIFFSRKILKKPILW